MNTKVYRRGWSALAMACCLLVLTSQGYAGIPEPSLVLFGKVLDTDGALVTSGLLQWNYESVDGATSVTVVTELGEVLLNGELFSYSVQVPIETEFPGNPAKAGTLPLGSSPVDYNRTPLLDGQSATLQVSRRTTVDADSRGSFEQIDLRVLGDGTFTWGDLASGLDSPVAIACDGTIGGQDASLILQWYAGLITELKSCPDGITFTAPDFPPGANVNGDSVLGGQDASEILKLYAGLQLCVPADTTCVGKDGPKFLMASNFAINTGPRTLSLPANKSLPGEGVYTFPVRIDNASGVKSYRVQIGYSGAQMELVSVANASLTAGWGQPVVNQKSGHLTIVNAGLNELSGGGALVDLTFRVHEGVLSGAQSLGALTELNDGALATVTIDGNFFIDSDGDGLPDAQEGRCADSDPECIDRDSDGDGVPDYLDRDSVELFLDKKFEVTLESDIKYGEGQIQITSAPITQDLYLDVYEPAGSDVPEIKPGLILIHGGALVSGDKTDGPGDLGSADPASAPKDYATAFAQRGYVAAVINYRLLPDDPRGSGILDGNDPFMATVINAIQTQIGGEDPTDSALILRGLEAAMADVGQAIDWMLTDPLELGIDPSRIAIAGHSTGGLIALHAAYAADEPIAAVWSNSGSLLGAANDVLPGDDTPLIFFHGDQDPVFSIEGARMLSNQLSNSDISYAYYEMGAEDHFYLISRPVIDPAEPSKSAPKTLERRAAEFLHGELDLSALGVVSVPVSSWPGTTLLLVSLLAAAALALFRRTTR